MAIKQAVHYGEFVDSFRDMGRENQFTYGAKRALFEYLDELSEDLGEDIELDVIALCCEYTEFESIEEFTHEYLNDDELHELGELAGDDTAESMLRAVREYLEERTAVIRCEEDCILIASY